MIDLFELDRRAALAMGWKLLTGGDGEAYGLPPTGGPWRGFDPTTDATDCREFEQWALREHKGWMLDVVVNSSSAAAGVHSSGEGKSRHTDRAEHGPSYDLVARVLALLAALEGENP